MNLNLHWSKVYLCDISRHFSLVSFKCIASSRATAADKKLMPLGKTEGTWSHRFRIYSVQNVQEESDGLHHRNIHATNSGLKVL